MSSGLGRGILVLGLLAACGGEGLPIEPPPGNQWRDPEGEPVPADVVRVSTGPGECGLDEVGLLWVQWPIGGGAGEVEARQYVGDPLGAIHPSRLEAPYDPRSTLPRGASFTGLATDDFQLFAGPDADLYLYLVSGPRVEAWPRADPPLTCETLPAP